MSAGPRGRRAWAALALTGAALLAAPLRTALEARMPLHMLVEFPWLLATGVALERAIPDAWRRRVPLDAEGLASAVVVASVLTYWMIPSRLDASLVEPGVAASKYLAWIAAGVALSRGLAAWRREVAVFVLGNTAWMTATAGLLYQQWPARLCVNYTQDDQAVAGQGLVALAAAMAAWALWRCVRPASRARTPTPTPPPPSTRPAVSLPPP